MVEVKINLEDLQQLADARVLLRHNYDKINEICDAVKAEDWEKVKKILTAMTGRLL